jgi:protein phosphatase
MKLYYYTNKGKLRDSNEDGILIDDKIISDDMDTPKKLEGEFHKFIVCDGMGGLEDSQKEVKKALEVLSKKFDDIETILKIINSNIQTGGFAIAGIVDNVVFNVGDCRVYKKEDIFLNKLTKDHSLVQSLVNNGIITDEEALTHPKKNIITSAIDGKEFEIYSKKIKMFDNDIFFICSDGVWGEFGIDELEDVFVGDFDTINENLFKALQNKKLEDNCSYILIKK